MNEKVIFLKTTRFDLFLFLYEDYFKACLSKTWNLFTMPPFIFASFLFCRGLILLNSIHHTNDLHLKWIFIWNMFNFCQLGIFKMQNLRKIIGWNWVYVAAPRVLQIEKIPANEEKSFINLTTQALQILTTRPNKESPAVKLMKMFSWFAGALSICMCFLKLQPLSSLGHRRFILVLTND